MEQTRTEVHSWGKRNRVSFDSTKEHICILHHAHGSGESFLLLGCLLDVRLNMHDAIDDLVRRIRPKGQALLRTRGLYNHADMLMQYKTHIWSLAEYHNGVIMHASDSSLDRLDRVQKSFLDALQLTEEVAFIDYNFPPPALRRDIGMLDFLHKRVLGQCHGAIKKFFPLLPAAPPWHDKQLEGHLFECIAIPSLYFRSLLGVVHIYNRLPLEAVDLDSVSKFQSFLNQMAKQRCARNISTWRRTLHR